MQPRNDAWFLATKIRLPIFFSLPWGHSMTTAISKVARHPPDKKPPSPAKRNQMRARAFRPLALEIGWLVYQWNRLHEAMAELFSDIASPKEVQIGFAIWHSTPNDRTQRDMLDAAIKARGGHNFDGRQYNDVVWLLKQLKELAGKRNNAIHAPMIFATDPGTWDIEILPNYFFGNPRATELRNKNLLQEFRWYKDHLARLADFAERLHFASAEGFPWPDRPPLPSVGQYRNQKPSHHKNTAK